MEQRRKQNMSTHRIHNQFANEKLRRLVSERKNIQLPTLCIQYYGGFKLRSVRKRNKQSGLETFRTNKQNHVQRIESNSNWKKQHSLNLLKGYAKRQKRMKISQKKLAGLFSRYDTMPNHSEQLDKSIDEISQTLRHKIDVIYF